MFSGFEKIQTSAMGEKSSPGGGLTLKNEPFYELQLDETGFLWYLTVVLLYPGGMWGFG